MLKFIQHHDDFLQLAESNQRSASQRQPACVNGTVRVIGVRNEDTPCLRPSAVHTNHVRGNFIRAKRLVPPFHFDEVQITVNFHDAIDLFDDSFSTIPFEGERFPNEHPIASKSRFRTLSSALPRLCASLSANNEFKSLDIVSIFSRRSCTALIFSSVDAFVFAASVSLSMRIRVKASFTSTTLRTSATRALAFTWSFSQQVRKSSNSVSRLTTSRSSRR